LRRQGDRSRRDLTGERRCQLPRWHDVLAIWGDRADDMCGRAIASGHFLAEETPEETLAKLDAFFTG